MKVEVVTYNIESVRIAAKLGASRVELCSNELIGGLSPSVALLQLIKEEMNIPVFCMVRPRSGDFVYNEDEIKIIRREIKAFKNAGADGIVCGVLKDDGSVDKEMLGEIVQASFPLPVTFHRAFDFVSDPMDALEKIVASGCARILTSGLKKTAEAGIPLIKELIEFAANKIIILPGAGIDASNVKKIIVSTGCSEIHLSAKKMVQRKSNLNTNLQLGTESESNQYQCTDENVLMNVMRAINEI